MDGGFIHHDLIGKTQGVTIRDIIRRTFAEFHPAA